MHYTHNKFELNISNISVFYSYINLLYPYWKTLYLIVITIWCSLDVWFVSGYIHSVLFFRVFGFTDTFESDPMSEPRGYFLECWCKFSLVMTIFSLYSKRAIFAFYVCFWFCRMIIDYCSFFWFPLLLHFVVTFQNQEARGFLILTRLSTGRSNARPLST